MSSKRDPLQPIAQNVPRAAVNLPHPRKLAPIFLRPSSSSSSSSNSLDGSSRKRVKLDAPAGHGGELNNDDGERGHGRTSSLHDFFHPSASSSSCVEKKDRKAIVVPSPSPSPPPSVWRRPRRRFGVNGTTRSSLLVEPYTQPISEPPAYLPSFVTSIAGYNPLTPPSLLFLPSIHPPNLRLREFAPPLAVAFNDVAKRCTLDEKPSGSRRLVAVAGEEGGVRIVDVDEGLGDHPEQKGFWWRAHTNAVFEVKWSADDTRLLTMSGDRTTRLHALTSPTPTLLATLRGHTSSVRAAVFFDPSRSAGSDASQGSIVASAGRDGNILIYDLRCKGTPVRDPHPSYSERAGRARYSAGVAGFAAQTEGQEIDPVITLKSAHGDGERMIGRSATKSVTSLVALESMPGILASGGSANAIVKLWDVRLPTARSSRPTCTPLSQLSDPTIHSPNPSRRPRSINTLVEQSSTGDLFALCGNSRVYTLRPSDDTVSGILPGSYADDDLLVSTFYVKMAASRDGRYLVTGSSKGNGVIAFDTEKRSRGKAGVKLGMGMETGTPKLPREVGAVDIGKDIIVGCCDDQTRIWRSNYDVAGSLRDEPGKASDDWLGRSLR